MPYEIIWQKHGVHRRLYGFVSAADIRNSFTEMHELERYGSKSIYYILHDLSEMTGRDWGKGEITMLGANHLGASVGNKQLHDIVVSTNEDFIDALGSSVFARLLPHGIEFFESLADAHTRVEKILAKVSGQ